MWNIPDQRVVDWADVHEMVTAVNFLPDGSKATVGSMKGKCRFYRCSNFQLEYEAQIGASLTLDAVGRCANPPWATFGPLGGTGAP